MLHFIQQFPVTVDITGGMLYSVQDFSKKDQLDLSPLTFHHPRIRGSHCIVHIHRAILSLG